VEKKGGESLGRRLSVAAREGRGVKTGISRRLGKNGGCFFQAAIMEKKEAEKSISERGGMKNEKAAVTRGAEL
jgi:hypothetical protein